MKESDRVATAPMLYERNDSYVIEAFRQGEFDYLEGVGEVSEADFFRAIAGKNILRKLAETYPSACKKHDVPVWVYLASDLSMRFHGVGDNENGVKTNGGGALQTRLRMHLYWKAMV